MSASPHPLRRADDAAERDLAQTLVQFIRDEIPLARAMDLSLQAASPDQLSLAVPLAPNVNDKGCAFGGSLVSLMTLAGWALVELALRRRGDDCDVFVGESTVRYLAPRADWATFFDTLDARGRARIEVACEVPGTPGKPAATLLARFVAKRRAQS